MMIYDEVGEFLYPDSDVWNSECDTIVIPVNVVGVMGAGLAKQAAVKYKGLLHQYRMACKEGRLTIDSLWMYKAPDGRNILCFPTKKHWRDDSKVEWIENNLKLLAETWEELEIDSIAMPAIGCGLGGLSWLEDVAPLVYKYLDDIDPPVYIYLKGHVS